VLVLTRKPGQLVHIGSDIVVTVLESRGGQIRLGISAPRDLPVHRDEALDRYQDVLEIETTPAVASFEPAPAPAPLRARRPRPSLAPQPPLDEPIAPEGRRARRAPLSDRLRREPALRTS
jgi:carbon storage regulator